MKILFALLLAITIGNPYRSDGQIIILSALDKNGKIDCEQEIQFKDAEVSLNNNSISCSKLTFGEGVKTIKIKGNVTITCDDLSILNADQDVTIELLKPSSSLKIIFRNKFDTKGKGFAVNNGKRNSNVTIRKFGT